MLTKRDRLNTCAHHLGYVTRCVNSEANQQGEVLGGDRATANHTDFGDFGNVHLTWGAAY